MSSKYAWIAKKLAFSVLKKLLDYREVYKPISEASYLKQQCEYKRPKYTKLKKFFVSIIIYTFMLSLAYNILLIREVAELKENLDFLLNEAKKLNDENQSMIDEQVKKEFKRIDITQQKVKYVEKYSIEPK